MKHSEFANKIYNRVYASILRIEQAANSGPVDADVTAQLRADARALSEDDHFRRAYASRQGWGDMWLNKMITDAGRPVSPSEMPSDRELWQWLKCARARAEVTEGVLL